MKVVIAGGHGKIALILEKLLAERGHSVAGLVRNPAYAADLAEAGAETIVLDLEKATVSELAGHLAGADAVVFAAGAGAGSGSARKETVDRDAAVLLADAAEAAGVGRYLLVSAMGDHLRADPADFEQEFGIYMRAKAAAEDAVRARSNPRATIVRPGLLNNDPGTGRVNLGDRTGTGPIPRADVSAVLLALLEDPRLDGRTVEVIGGTTPIVDALDTLAGA
ncbi:NAD(P)H-binding protein [Streptomyces sp. AC555_RSS877]|uniref:NAD(P)H-binding protein n=1 Tax=Streptomyces sp. AC555_RSS877 TaxID=2823688 RepID=UPI001C271062|nr:NAD(P)H-binding protein [Streptomyces sp. AC555_RSS877]